MVETRALTLTLTSAETTDRLGHALAELIQAGDILALSGPIGAGKSHLSRALIRSRLNALHRAEDIPSPTFTLVQTYDVDAFEIWHCDLYRLTHPDEVLELGLDTAFDTQVCLIEWPDRLGDDLPTTALHIALTPDPVTDHRTAELQWTNPAWDARVTTVRDCLDAG